MTAGPALAVERQFGAGQCAYLRREILEQFGRAETVQHLPRPPVELPAYPLTVLEPPGAADFLQRAESDLVVHNPDRLAVAIDVRTRRLPDRLLLAGAVPALLIALADRTLLGALLGAAVFVGPLLLAHLIDPHGLGFGDVKLAAVLGLIVGSTDWRLVLPALGIASVVSVLWLLARRATSLAFGPALVGGAATMMFIGGVA